MKLQKKVSAQGEYAKVGEDIKDGDTLKIMDSGTTVTGEWGDREVFKVQTRNGEKNLTFNQTSVNNIIDAYGEESEKYVGKNIKAFIIKQRVGESLKNVVYVVGEGWTMTDDGKFVKEGAVDSVTGETSEQMKANAAF